jgi:hypothetical protein
MKIKSLGAALSNYALNEDFFAFHTVASATMYRLSSMKDEIFTISRIFYNPTFIGICHYSCAFDFEIKLFHCFPV